MFEKIHFREVSIEDRCLWNSYLSLSGIRFCDFSFLNICAWKFYYQTELAEWKGYLLIRHYFDDNFHYFFPIGDGNIAEVLNDLKTFAFENHHSFLMDCLTINQLEEIKTISIHPFSFSLDRNFSDYLYLREDWIALKGKRLQSKRNHLKRFLQNYEYEYKPYTDAYLNDCISLSKQWMKENPDLNWDSMNNELQVIQFALNNLEQLGGCGGTLWVDGQLVAFSLGSSINEDTFVVHIEKANTSYEGIYVAMGNIFAQNLPDNYTFLNREDDMGLKGLRQSKLSYSPHKLLAKFSINFSAENTIEESKLKLLWETVFHDNPTYINDFFSDLRGEYNSVFKQDKEKNLLSSMYLVKYEFQLLKQSLPLYYFYAIATDKSVRNQGLATSMIYESIWRGFIEKIGMAFLVPANHELIDFYSNFGFAPWMYSNVTNYSCEKLERGESRIRLSECLLNKKIRISLIEVIKNSELAILPSETLLDFWIQDTRNDGKVFYSIIQNEKMVAWIIVENCDYDKLLKISILGSITPIPLNDLLLSLKELFPKVSSIEIQQHSLIGETPHSLCRIIHLPTFLDQYVKIYHGDPFAFYYHDELLPPNSGYYKISVSGWQKVETLGNECKVVNSLTIIPFLFREKIGYIGNITYCSILQ
jgi:predicted GNAT family N-acyltransferase